MRTKTALMFIVGLIFLVLLLLSLFVLYELATPGVPKIANPLLISSSCVARTLSTRYCNQQVLQPARSVLSGYKDHL